MTQKEYNDQMEVFRIELEQAIAPLNGDIIKAKSAVELANLNWSQAKNSLDGVRAHVFLIHESLRALNLKKPEPVNGDTENADYLKNMAKWKIDRSNLVGRLYDRQREIAVMKENITHRYIEKLEAHARLRDLLQAKKAITRKYWNIKHEWIISHPVDEL